jgi:hypothetical protein
VFYKFRSLGICSLVEELENDHYNNKDTNKNAREI